ncbi:GntT/GntP/DsdX family permease [Nocardioides daeguensis]|uniref:GntP family permease n=1 Tax=Nocardioides daeguensis TaxID=908359 RepID=A0ABP6VAV5_9ACTN|nr:hypothetical protein [Nocardioides daeguensis]MBV6729377.1 hypothetical protein [Nocardioides daeguensis]MCR1771850.1 hypothetical protein [Nocardioides daeguensis]
MSVPLIAAGTDLVEPVASEGRLVLAALLGIGVIVVLIIAAKVHPFLALTGGALTVGVVAGVDVETAIASYTTGFGATAAGVGILIALGAMFGKLLADSGGADQIVDTIIGHASPRALPWAMAVVGACDAVRGLLAGRAPRRGGRPPVDPTGAEPGGQGHPPRPARPRLPDLPHRDLAARRAGHAPAAGSGAPPAPAGGEPQLPRDPVRDAAGVAGDA